LFTTSILVRFGDLDSAGIAYYPRIVDFLTRAFEDFFAGHVGKSFPEVLASGLGFPTVKLDMEFLAPVRHGDSVLVKVAADHVGRSSVRMLYEGSVAGRPVFRAHNTVVAVDKATFRSVPLPEWLRERFLAARAAGAGA
jgi:4-hydroxybenzoyl-CoA thioesterase